MLVATCLLPAEAVALEATLSSEPDVAVEAERIAAHSTEWTMPCLWITSPDPDGTEAAVTADPTVASVVDTEQLGEERYYHVEWTAAVQDRIDAYVDKRATILRAHADADGWELRIRFAERDQFDAFRERLDAEGHSFRLRTLTEPGSSSGTVGKLTPEQFEALRTAIERGYFRVPREVTTRELAAELDRSHQSVSELLRRGMENLVEDALAEERVRSVGRSGSADGDREGT